MNDTTVLIGDEPWDLVVATMDRLLGTHEPALIRPWEVGPQDAVQQSLDGIPVRRWSLPGVELTMEASGLDEWEVSDPAEAVGARWEINVRSLAHDIATQHAAAHYVYARLVAGTAWHLVLMLDGWSSPDAHRPRLG